MKNKLFYFILLCVPLLFWTCLEEIDFDIPDDQRNKIAVQGKLMYGTPSIFEGTVTSLFEFDGGNNPDRKADAEVRLLNKNGQNLLIPFDITRDQFRLEIAEGNPDFDIELGGEYMLQVNLIDGRNYESDWQFLLPTPEPETILTDIIQKTAYNSTGTLETNDYLQFSIKTPLNQGASALHYLWDAEGVYRLTDGGVLSNFPNKTCYIEQQVANDKLLLADGNLFNQNEATIPLVDKKIDFHFAEGYYINLYQQAITKSTFKYFQKISELIDRDASIYQAPAGKVLGNISRVDAEEEVFGFFYATQAQTIRLKINPEDVGNPRFYCPPIQPPRSETWDSHLCVDCLFGLNSSLQKPVYWVD